MTYDVLAINLATNAVRVIARGKSKQHAEGIVAMAVMRRGIYMELFGEVPENSYRDGMQWQGSGCDV